MKKSAPHLTFIENGETPNWLLSVEEESRLAFVVHQWKDRIFLGPSGMAIGFVLLPLIVGLAFWLDWVLEVQGFVLVGCMARALYNALDTTRAPLVRGLYGFVGAMLAFFGGASWLLAIFLNQMVPAPQATIETYSAPASFTALPMT